MSILDPDRIKCRLFNEKPLAGCGCGEDVLCKFASDLRDTFLKYRGGRKKKSARDEYSRHRRRVLNPNLEGFTVWPAK